MKDPVLVTKPLLPSMDEYVEKLKTIWDNQWLTNNGELCQQLQRSLQDRMQAPYVELFTNGHMALDIIIKAMGLSGEVITTPFSFASTTHALVLNGITPVFCDIHPDNFTIDETKIERLITPRTSAILPVHVYGWPCKTIEINRIAKKHNLKVIYDAAHAFDVTVNGKPLVLEGDASMLSFHATKVFNTIEGGALVLHDEHDVLHVTRLRNFGIAGAESVPEVGLNAKMNEFAAAMGLCNLNHVDQAIVHRKSLTEKYMARLGKLPGIRTLAYEEAKERGIRLNYAYMPISISQEITGFSRDQLFTWLGDKGILARKYFYPLISDFECYADQFNSAATPVAKKVASDVMTLPMSGSTTLEEVDRVCTAIEEFYQQSR